MRIRHKIREICRIETGKTDRAPLLKAMVGKNIMFLLFVIADSISFQIFILVKHFLIVNRKIK